MRLFSVVAATLVLGGMPAAAQDGNHRTKQPTPPPPIYVKHTEVTMLVTKGEGHRTELNQGYTTIGEPHPIKCVHDQGCVVTAVSMVEIGGYSGKWAICTLVDGVPTTPLCPNQNLADPQGSLGNGLASTLLSKGRHVVETGVDMKDAVGARLGNWEVHYTILLDPPAGK